MVHDVFVVALGRRHHFRGDAKVSTWLFGITEHVVRKRRWRDRLRRFLWRLYRSQAELTAPESATPLDEVERKRLAAELYRGLDRLPEKDRTVLALYDLEGLAAEEVGELLGIQPNAVWVRVHRARARLVADLTKHRGRGPR